MKWRGINKKVSQQMNKQIFWCEKATFKGENYRTVKSRKNNFELKAFGCFLENFGEKFFDEQFFDYRTSGHLTTKWSCAI